MVVSPAIFKYYRYKIPNISAIITITINNLVNVTSRLFTFSYANKVL